MPEHPLDRGEENVWSPTSSSVETPVDSGDNRTMDLGDVINDNVVQSNNHPLAISTISNGAKMWPHFDASVHPVDLDCKTCNDIAEKVIDQHKETRRSFCLEISMPFILAGFGMVAAGVLLEKASNWTFFREVPEALVLVPALLGLKGNLEMTLASRLSTMANLGYLDKANQRFTVLYSNIALIQAQAIVVALFASLLTVFTHYLDEGKFDAVRSLCVLLAAVMAASVASIFLASMMVLLTIVARKMGVNPDNIATPLAAATGDVTALAFLIAFGSLFYNIRYSLFQLDIGLLVFLIFSTFVWMYVASTVKMTREVLKYGWFSVLIAMFISSAGGYILRHSVTRFPSITLFQPVINGVGGNLVAVQASKISTYLHRFGKQGILPANTIFTYLNPLRTFNCKERESSNALILLSMALPGHILFTLLIYVIQNGGENSNSIKPNASFLSLYILAALLQVALLLFICQLLCRLLWLLRCNPDNNAIPLLTALGDLFGTALLVLAFTAHHLLDSKAEWVEVIDATTAISNTTMLNLNETLTF